MDNGIKQGGLLSPLLFNLYINILLIIYNKFWHRMLHCNNMIVNQCIINTSHDASTLIYAAPPSDSSRPMQLLLLSGDVHQNPSPATKYPYSVCTSNVTSRGVSYMCNRCSGWVHSKCSGLQNAAEYRRIKNWTCISCSSPPTNTDTASITNYN